MMMKVLLVGACALIAATTAPAHFVFVVPDKDGSTATVVLSDDLQTDEAVDAAKIAGLTLNARDAAGKDATVSSKAGKHSLTAELPGSGPRVVFGSLTYGVMQKGEGKPYLLCYHPKALVGAIAADKATIGEKLPIELLALTDGGKVRFNVLATGKPLPDAEVTVLKPDGSKVKVVTGKDGLTEAIEGTGRFGAWSRFIDPKAGEHAGRKYEEVRHYATLVVDIAAGGR
jgi:uncharacterized GH25 family protein